MMEPRVVGREVGRIRVRGVLWNCSWMVVQEDVPDYANEPSVSDSEW